MQRRDAVKAIAISTVTPNLLLTPSTGITNFRKPVHASSVFASTWQNWPDVLWAGPEFWGNRLQDWQIQNGKVVCNISDVNRTLHALTCQLSEQPEAFETSVIVALQNRQVPASPLNYTGFRVGAKAIIADYSAAAVFGEGLDAGITTVGNLFIGDQQSEKQIELQTPILLQLQAIPIAGNYQIKLSALNAANQKPLAEMEVSDISPKDLEGNLALVAHFKENNDKPDVASIAFDQWHISGAKVTRQQEQTFGPVCFAQYTLHQGTLKLSAQMAPVEAIPNYKVSLQLKPEAQWETVQESKIDDMGRSAQFRQENWNYTKPVPYRIQVILPLKSGNQEFTYEGTIAQEPIDSSQLKVAVFSCNGDFGFPDNEVSLHVNKHNPDLAVFLGDQFYESTGGFGIQTSPIDKASLDYLRKWLMFGWSYREIFRHIPCACIPDDHDVYHGNVWGEGGKNAPTDQSWGYEAQDQGGYKMPPEWVNMVQRTQTGHLPDAYDSTPVKQGIGVYYTHWNYAGISFAILEDRKFKSAPKNVLPEEAQVTNGFIQNRDFDIKKHRDVEADLLGERQLSFLRDWSADWSHGIQMKAVFSQTNFCTVATLPEGSIIDSIVPKLPIPEPGQYVPGDAPTSDMDSNGWPQNGRDDALRIIRKCFALHIAGDQHLASTVHYGVDDFQDAGFAFAGPALNNIFPRRWWPPVDASHQPLAGKPQYTGNFYDGFGNRMTVHAVANPHQTHREPAIVYDRATGYGMVTFDKQARTMTIECWPRYADPKRNPQGQYEGWPITVSQQDNYSRKPAAYLDELRIEGATNPVVEVVNEQTEETVYIMRLKGNRFRPHVFEAGRYTIRITEPDTNKEKTLKGLQAVSDTKKPKVTKVRL